MKSCSGGGTEGKGQNWCENLSDILIPVNAFEFCPGCSKNILETVVFAGLSIKDY